MLATIQAPWSLDTGGSSSPSSFVAISIGSAGELQPSAKPAESSSKVAENAMQFAVISQRRLVLR